MVEEYKTTTGLSWAEEQARARAMDEEYKKYQKAQEEKKKKKLKEEQEIEFLKQQVEKTKKAESERKENVAKMQEKAKLQSELNQMKMEKYKAVGQNVKNIFSNIGTTFGKVGGALMGEGNQAHPVTQPARALQKQIIQHPVRQQVQQATQTVPVQTQGFVMPDFNNILRQSGVMADDMGMMQSRPSFAPSVRAKMQVKRRTKLKKKMKRTFKQRGRRTIPRIPRIQRMPRSPSVVQQNKPFDISDVLRGLPQ